MKSISTKVTLLYIFLSIFNISIFTFYIYENQMDLIIENTKLIIKDKANEIYKNLNSVIIEINNNQNKYNSEEIILKTINRTIENMISQYIIFKISSNKNADILYESTKDFKMEQEYIQRAELSAANKEFSGKFFDSQIDDKQNEILFYVPLSINKLENTFLLFRLDKMKEMNTRVKTLYFLVGFIIIVISIFHLVVGVLLHLIIIRPIKTLSKKSNEISKGNLSARVQIKRKDEIGQLGIAFNDMASSIQEKIVELDKQNKKMLLELKMAREVQKSIYPVIRQTDKFDIAIYHRPLIEVSGDYHDIIPLGNNRYGIIIADVSGHGIAAALITMLIKNFIQRSAYKYKDSKEFMIFMNTEFANLMEEYNSFFTAFYLIIDEDNIITFSNASHLKPYLLKTNDNKMYELDTNGGVIGMSEDFNKKFLSKRIKLKSNDKIILFTDGIIESQNKNDEMFDFDRLVKTIVKNNKYNSEIMLKNILKDFNDFIDAEKRRDDETIIILEIKK